MLRYRLNWFYVSTGPRVCMLRGKCRGWCRDVTGIEAVLSLMGPMLSFLLRRHHTPSVCKPHGTVAHQLAVPRPPELKPCSPTPDYQHLGVLSKTVSLSPVRVLPVPQLLPGRSAVYVVTLLASLCSLYIF